MCALQGNECRHIFGFLGPWVFPNHYRETTVASASYATDMEMATKKIANDSKTLTTTTFVEADTKTFKDVVQRLTGSSEAAGHDQVTTTTKGSNIIGIKKPEFKLHERRQYKANKLEIIKPPMCIKQGAAGVLKQHFQEQFTTSGHLTSSPMTTPTKYFSGLSLVETENRSEPIPMASNLNTHEEEKAIRERRFYLHPSPRSKPGFNEPQLLTLFPLTSPKTSGISQGD